MSSNTKSAHWEEINEGLGTIEEADDLLHPEMSKSEPGYQLSETHYFGFNVPEHEIHGFGTVWYHPNLGTLLGGVAAWQGFKKHPLQSEIWDIVNYMSDECLKEDNWHYKLENGYEVRTIKPLESHEIRYQSPTTDSWIDLSFNALTPPVMFASGFHFDQAMRVTGEVRLRGRTYPVNSTSVRDRSFGQLRMEQNVPLPPVSWMNCGFSENLAFSCTAFDDPQRNPDWSGALTLPEGNPLRAGWIHKDGVASEVVQASKISTRRPGSLYQDEVELTITDALGRTLELRGTTISGVNWRCWANCELNMCGARWECDGEVAYGDCQEFMWAEYIRQFHP